MKSFDLAGKTYILTGADGFLGKYIRLALFSEGAKVISTDVKSSETAIQLDISKKSNIEKLASNIKEQGLKIDGIINNAAVSYKGRDIAEDKFLDTLQINIAGTNHVIDVFKSLIQEKGSIVNISSIYGTLSPDFEIYNGNEELFNNASYSASKAAIIQMTRYYAVLLAPVRCNSVSPGGIFQGHKDSFSDKYSDRVPLKRMANPEEIVNGILFLLSPLSSYTTGQNFIIDGGLSAL